MPQYADALRLDSAKIALGRGVSVAQVSLNYLLRKPGITSLIVGARTRDQLADNLAAARTLHTHGLTGTFFITAGCLAGADPFWPAEIRAQVAAMRQPVIDLRVGERVDVLAAIPRPGTPATSADSAASAASAVVVAEDVRVVATPTTPDGGSAALDSTAGDGALVVLATTPDQARSLAQAELTARLSAVVVR